MVAGNIRVKQKMAFITIFYTSILPIFIIVALAAVYCRLMRPDIPQIANLAIMVFVPILVFDSLIKNKITLPMLLKPIIFMLLLTGTLMLLAHLTAKAIKARENERITLILAASMINVGNFGLPLIYFAFGKEAEAYSILYFTAFNLPLATVAIYISSREKKVGKILVDVAKIPILYAVILALIISEWSIPMPLALSKGMGLMSQATIPLIIFVLGLQLSNLKIKMSYLKIIFFAVGIRLIISPFIASLSLQSLNITGVEQQVALVQTSTPTALLPLMYAIRFNRSPDLLAAIILITTLLSGISLTVLIKIIM